MNCSKTFAAGAMALMLACSATAARGQTAPSVVESTVSATQSDDAMDQDLAQQISLAASEGKDVSNAVAFQLKGEMPTARATRNRPSAILRPPSMN